MKTETGGVIAGTGTVARDGVVVTHATGPGPRAFRTKYSFARDVRYCQDQIDQLARDSGGEIDYLGEWHKHHEPEPWPSNRDLGTLAAIARDANYHVSVPLLLIIGESNNRNSLRVFAVEGRGRLTQLEWDCAEPAKAGVGAEEKCDVGASGLTAVEAFSDESDLPIRNE